MGINGLWTLLRPAAQVYTLNDISLMNGYSSAKPNNILRIGVDISVVMNECVAAEHDSHLYQYRTSGELRTFFFKLCKFLREAPEIIIFVFDGPNRPSFKHGRHIDTQTVPEWVNHCKTIIEAFGFYWHQAPGEAEAELAMLSRCGAIDAVMTNDSDALVFGAQCVIKRMIKRKNSSAPDKYLLYSMDVVENTVGLSYGGLLLVALLSKSDYSNGLAGCGPSISASLARCGFGDRILHAFEKLEDFKLRRELESIAMDIRAELRTNSQNLLNSRYPMLAANFNVEMIAPEKISAFINPIVSITSPSPSLLPPAIPTWIIKEPSIPRISQFCTQTLNWAHTALDERLANILWPGIFLRILCSSLLVYDHAEKLCATPYTQTTISRAYLRERKNKVGRWARVHYSTDNFVALLGISTNRETRPPNEITWVAVDYLPAQLISTLNVPRSHHVSMPRTSTGVLVPAPAPACQVISMPDIARSRRVTPSASTSGLAPASLMDSSNADLSASESPDPPTIIDVIDLASQSRKLAKIGVQNSGEVLQITDSESDVEIVHSPHQQVRSVSPEYIVISD